MFGIPFLIVGMPLLAGGILINLKCYSVRKWPTSTGTVIDSFVKSKSDNRERSRNIFEPVVKYEYDVSGRKLSSTRYSFYRYRSYDEKSVEDIIRAHPKGRTIKVYYSLRNNQIAVIEPGPTEKTLYMLLMGVILTGLGILAIAKP